MVEIIDLDPLVVTVEIPQTHIGLFLLSNLPLFASQMAEAEAVIRFIDRQANQDTRTFATERIIKPRYDYSGRFECLSRFMG